MWPIPWESSAGRGMQNLFDWMELFGCAGAPKDVVLEVALKAGLVSDFHIDSVCL